MTNDIIELALDLVDDPDIAMREDVHDDQIDSLVASIKQVGLLEPIVVRAIGNRYQLIAGHRRMTAMRIIGNALCLAKVLDVGEDQALTIRMHENAHRENVNPVDEAVYIAQVMTKLELSVSDISERLNRSLGYVYDRLALLDLPGYLIQHVASKKISISAAIILNKIDDDLTKRNFVDIAAKDGITVERANAWYMMANSGIVSPQTTGEQLQAMAEPEKHNEVLITCARCKAGAPVGQMLTVWIHRQCPSEHSDDAPNPSE